MKKQFRPKMKRRFVGKAEVNPFMATVQRFANTYVRVMKYLAPLIKKDAIPPAAAAVLIACYADAVMVGDDKQAEHRMSEDDIHAGVNLFLNLWKQGKVIAPAEYPYTLEETLKEEEDEGQGL